MHTRASNAPLREYVPSAASVEECLGEERRELAQQSAVLSDCPAIASANPKDIAAREKCPLHLIPPIAETQTAWALQHGNSKYGPWNWREKEISLMTYIGAMRRHLNRLADGEDEDAESKMAHLSHVAATACILMDAWEHECVIDDRPGK